jgi:hypothetical protein
MYVSEESEKYCVNCYASTQFVDMQTINNDKSVAQMVAMLTERGYQNSTTDHIEDIMDMYDTVVTKDGGIYNEIIIDTVSVPLHPTSYLKHLNKVVTIDLSAGGLCVCDTKLMLNDLVETLKIMCELVNVNTTRTGDVQDILSRTYSVIPTLIIDMAQKARFDSGGYRLLKRCIRHAMDTFAIDVCQCQLSLVKLMNEQVGLLMTHKVRASMKTDVYDVTVCFTKSEIQACECSCRCGSKLQDRVLCIHILPCLYQITLLIFDGPAEHVLIELAAHISTLNESDFTNIRPTSYCW